MTRFPTNIYTKTHTRLDNYPGPLIETKRKATGKTTRCASHPQTPTSIIESQIPGSGKLGRILQSACEIMKLPHETSTTLILIMAMREHRIIVQTIAIRKLIRSQYIAKPLLAKDLSIPRHTTRNQGLQHPQFLNFKNTDLHSMTDDLAQWNMAGEDEIHFRTKNMIPTDAPNGQAVRHGEGVLHIMAPHRGAMSWPSQRNIQTRAMVA